jgi:hypothetical protein
MPIEEGTNALIDPFQGWKNIIHKLLPRILLLNCCMTSAEASLASMGLWYCQVG